MPWQFLMQLMQGQKPNAAMGEAQNWIRGLDKPNVGALQDWDPSNQAFGELMNFNPQMSQGVEGTLSNLMQNPWGPGAAGGTLQEMLRTGAPTDATGIWQGARARGEGMLREGSGDAMERAAMSGGLAGSGLQNKLANLSAGIGEEAMARGGEAEFMAAESAANRRLGALNPALAGQNLRMGAAGTMGGLEGMFSGQRLGALGTAGGLETAQNAQQLSRAGTLADIFQRGQISQANLGTDVGKFMMMNQGQGPGMTPQNALNYMLGAQRGWGGQANTLQEQSQRQSNQLNRSNMASMIDMLGGYGANPTQVRAGKSGPTASNIRAYETATGEKHPSKNPYYSLQAQQGARGFGPYGGVNPMKVGGPKKTKFIEGSAQGTGGSSGSNVPFSAPTYTPGGSWNAGAGSNNPVPPVSDPNFTEYWRKYAEMMTNPAYATAGGYAGA